MARLLLPAIAAVLVAVTLGVMAVSGGGDYTVTPPRDPCRAPLTDRANDLERLGQAVVLTGLDATACDLGITRERLVLGLATTGSRRALARSLRVSDTGLAVRLGRGLDAGVHQLDRGRRLPRVSALLPEILSFVDLPGLVEDIARRIPDDLVDSVLPTGPVLRRAVATVDLDAILDGLGDERRLEDALRDAIVSAATTEARERIARAVRERSGPFGPIVDDILG